MILANRNDANSTQVAARYIDLPKGAGLQDIDGTVIVDDAFHIRRLGGDKWYRDVFNVNQLAAEIESRFQDKCVGYGYSIAHEGQIVKGGGGGCRLLASDGGPLPFTEDTQKDTQSTAKTITAVAALHVMEAHGLDVDDFIEPYLPHYWPKGPGVEFLTFGHLLSHRSGLSDIGDADEYDNLKQTIATGSPDQNWILPEYAYRNANYALFRLIIAYIDRPADMQNFEDNGLRGESINERCSERYLAYVQTHVLQPAALGTRHAYYTSDNHAFSYNFENQGVVGYPQQTGQMYEMGAGGWVLSAKDYAKFLAALENGNILSDEMLGEMKSGLLGLVWIDSPLGVAYGHGGSIGGGSDGTYGSGRGARAQSLMLPNNVQIYITINSANNDPSIEDSTERMEALRDSFVESLHPTP
ncbi:MAG: serine hydrolase domain-containing protein [Pirellulales bacterium]